MGEEPPANLSFEDGYLRVAGDYARAEFLKTIAHSHALGNLRVSGWPNGKSERRGIPPNRLSPGIWLRWQGCDGGS